MVHRCQDLIAIFNDCFSKTYNTQLIRGEDEPIYRPADAETPYHAIYFAHGFYSSALHESAHWLIAGQQRRMLIDFGYWYLPDGRTQEEQSQFQRVEVKPQALEWILSNATGYRFHISIDNLNGETCDSDTFKEAVYQQVATYCAHGLSERATHFRNALCQFYGQDKRLTIDDFNLVTS